MRLLPGGGDAPREPVFVDAEAHEEVGASLQRQVLAGATLLVAPYRLCGDPADEERQLDLRLARAAARQFRELRLGDAGRELYAGVRVEVATLRDPLARVGLIAAYAALEVQGYIVKIDDFDEDVEACAEFVFGLESQSGRPVVAAFDADWEQEAVQRAAARVRRRLAQSG